MKSNKKKAEGVDITVFFDAYLECAMWSSTDESNESGGDPIDDNYGVEDVDEKTYAEMYQDCIRFCEENAVFIRGRESQAGHAFWLTRNGHGAGFWDGNWPTDIGAKLTTRSKHYGGYNLIVGDDGKVYGM